MKRPRVRGSGEGPDGMRDRLVERKNVRACRSGKL